MGPLSSKGHLHTAHRLPAQFPGRRATDLVPLIVLERPFTLHRIEAHPHPSTGPHHSHAVRPVVHRKLASPIHLAGHSMRGHQIPDLLEVPGRFLACRVVGPTRVLQARISGQARLPAPDRIDLPLHPVHLLQAPLQLVARAACPRLAPLLADALPPLHHAIGLRAARRIGQDRDAQPRQPTDQVGGQVAPRSPGGPVVDPQPLGQAPPLERASQRRLGGLGVDLSPAAEGGKRRSSRRPRSPRRGSGASRLRFGRPGGCARRRRSARSDGATRPAWHTPRPASRPGRVPARRPGTSGGWSVGWARRAGVGPGRASPGLARPPRWDVGGGGRGRPGGSSQDGHGAGARAGRSRASAPAGPGRGTASRGDGPCVAAGRRRRPAKRRSRPGRLAPRASDAPGRGPTWASRRAPRENDQREGCPSISPSYPSCGKTYRAD
jgi:hypothetical protein